MCETVAHMIYKRRQNNGNYFSSPQTLVWQLLTLKLQSQQLSSLLCHLLVILKVIFANSVDPDQTAPLYLGPHCLPVCKNMFEKFARIFSR